jgi:hypothetical protein
MQCVDARGGQPVLPVTPHQPTLSADLATSVADPHAACEQDGTRDQHRGRIDTRSICVRIDRTSSLAAWPLVEQVAAVARTVTVRTTGNTSQDVGSLSPPVTPHEASLRELGCGHWGSEHSSHSVRDVTVGDDRSRVYAGHAPRIRAALRTLAIPLSHPPRVLSECFSQMPQCLSSSLGL